MDSLLESLLIVCRLEKRPVSRAVVLSGLPVQGHLTTELFIRAAQQASIKAKLLSKALSDIPTGVLPAVLLLKSDKADIKSCVLLKINHAKNTATIIDPEQPDDPKVLALAQLEALYAGQCFFLKTELKFEERISASFSDYSTHWFWGTLWLSIPIYRDVLLASLLINIFTIVSPLFVMNVYDRVVPNNAMETLWSLAIGTLIVFAFDFALKILRYDFLEVAGKKSDVLLTSKIFSKAMNLKMSARPVSVGSFASNLREFDSVRGFITSTTMVSLADLPFLFLFLLVIWYVGGSLVLIPLLIFPIVIIYGLISQFPLYRAVEKTYRSSAQKNALLIESLIGIETVKSLGIENELQHQWEQNVGHLAHWGQKSRIISATTNHFSAFMQQVVMVGMVVYGVYLISDQMLTLGGLVACVMLSSRVAAPISQIAGLLAGYQQAKIAYESLDDVMKLSDEVSDITESKINFENINGDISFKNVYFSYPNGSDPVLHDFSLEIKQGEKVAIIGRLGSGKTTVLKMLQGFYYADKGHLFIDGIDIRQLGIADVRRQISYVDQAPMFFYGTLKDNLTKGLTFISDEKIIEVIHAVGLMSLINSHPAGLNLMIAEQGNNLSGGQKQSLALARAMLRSPAIFSLDEPTSAMDNASEDFIKKSMLPHLQDKTVVLVTHKMSMLSLVDRVVVMDAGRKVADGPRDAVLAMLKEGKITSGVAK